MSDKNIDPEANRLFAEAVSLRDSGDVAGAIDVFQTLLKQFPEYEGPNSGMLGHCYWQIKDWENAVECYRRAVELSPRSALGSLGLFHSLFNMEKYDEGFAELRRFLSLAKFDERIKLEEHFLLIEEMSEELLEGKSFAKSGEHITLEEYFELIDELSKEVLENE